MKQKKKPKEQLRTKEIDMEKNMTTKLAHVKQKHQRLPRC